MGRWREVEAVVLAALAGDDVPGGEFEADLVLVCGVGEPVRVSEDGVLADGGERVGGAVAEVDTVRSWCEVAAPGELGL